MDVMERRVMSGRTPPSLPKNSRRHVKKGTPLPGRNSEGQAKLSQSGPEAGDWRRDFADQMRQRGIEWDEDSDKVTENSQPTQPSEAGDAPSFAKIRMLRAEDEDEPNEDAELARAIVQAALQGQMVVYGADTREFGLQRHEDFDMAPPPYAEYTREHTPIEMPMEADEPWNAEPDTQTWGAHGEHFPATQQPTTSATRALEQLIALERRETDLKMVELKNQMRTAELREEALRLEFEARINEFSNSAARHDPQAFINWVSELHRKQTENFKEALANLRTELNATFVEHHGRISIVGLELEHTKQNALTNNEWYDWRNKAQAEITRRDQQLQHLQQTLQKWESEDWVPPGIKTQLAEMRHYANEWGNNMPHYEKKTDRAYNENSQAQHGGRTPQGG